MLRQLVFIDHSSLFLNLSGSGSGTTKLEYHARNSDGAQDTGLCEQLSSARTSFSTSLVSVKLQITATLESDATKIGNQSVFEQVGIAIGI